MIGAQRRKEESRRPLHRRRIVDQPKSTPIHILSRNTIEISGAAKEHFVLVFSWNLSADDSQKLQAQIDRWNNGTYDLNTALILAGLFPDRIMQKMPDNSVVEVDPSTVLGRSFIAGRARDFIYNGAGLNRKSIAALEVALYRNSKDPRYDGYSYFRRSLPDYNQRALADIVFSRLTIGKRPVHGAFIAEASEVTTIKKDIDEMHFQRNEYAKATDWLNALITNEHGSYYLRIPKSLVKEEEFNKMIKAKKYPDEIAVIFRLGHVLDLMLQKNPSGPLNPIAPEDWEYVNSLPRNKLYPAKPIH